VPFRASFSCLWCGTPHTAASEDDLEGWAQLCPACIGKAGENEFIRFRVRQAIAERGAAKAPSEQPVAAVSGGAGAGAEPTSSAIAPRPAPRDRADDLVAYYEARAPEYDDWYLRRGRYERGPVHDAAWNAELDAAGRWLDALPIQGEIVELAAGTGWWSPLLATKGSLSLYDASSAPLERARERLLAHGLRAHLHVRDAWAEPDREVDAVFTGFWLSHVERDRLDAFLRIVRRWLKPGGMFAFIDSLRDPQSSAVDHPTPADDRSVRKLDDGREFTIVKVYYEPSELTAALQQAGFGTPNVTTTGRFFLLGAAQATEDAHTS
jgi:SAM-dependent methyltransferase